MTPETEKAEIEVIRHPRARRAKLAVDAASGRARLTLPPRAPLRPALAWAQGQDAWIAAQRARLPMARPLVDGAVVPVEDGALSITWTPEARRVPVEEGERLLIGGLIESVPRRVEAWLRARALLRLSEDTVIYAARAGVTVTRVAVSDPRGRWGSCAVSGAIRYSWRLICAPVAVRRQVAAHEVAHRVHMHHGPAFHALVAELYEADPTPARAWLREHGAALHRIGMLG